MSVERELKFQAPASPFKIFCLWLRLQPSKISPAPRSGSIQPWCQVMCRWAVTKDRTIGEEGLRYL